MPTVSSRLGRGLVVGATVGLAATGAVTCAPLAVLGGLLGAMGTCTGVGAGIASATGVMGFLAGAFFDKTDLKPVVAEQTQKLGDRDATINELVQSNTDLRTQRAEWVAFEQDQLRAVRVLVAAALADGPVNVLERNCITMRMTAASTLSLPALTRDKLETIFDAKITFSDASAHFDQITSCDLKKLIRTLLDVVMEADTEGHSLAPAEVAFLTAWDVRNQTSPQPEAA